MKRVFAIFILCYGGILFCVSANLLVRDDKSLSSLYIQNFEKNTSTAEVFSNNNVKYYTEIHLKAIPPKKLSTIENKLLKEYEDVIIVGHVYKPDQKKKNNTYQIYACYFAKKDSQYAIYTLQGEQIAPLSIGTHYFLNQRIFLNDISQDWMPAENTDPSRGYKEGYRRALSFQKANAINNLGLSYMDAKGVVFLRDTIIDKENLITISHPEVSIPYGTYDGISFSNGYLITRKVNANDTVYGLCDIWGNEEIACKYKAIRYDRQLGIFVKEEKRTIDQLLVADCTYLQQISNTDSTYIRWGKYISPLSKLTSFSLDSALIFTKELDFDFRKIELYIHQIDDKHLVTAEKTMKKNYARVIMPRESCAYYLVQNAQGHTGVCARNGEELVPPIEGKDIHYKGYLLVGDDSGDFNDHSDSEYATRAKHKNKMNIKDNCYFGIGHCKAVVELQEDENNNTTVLLRIPYGKYDGISYVYSKNKVSFIVYRYEDGEVRWGVCDQNGVEIIPCIYKGILDMLPSDIPMQQIYDIYAQRVMQNEHRIKSRDWAYLRILYTSSSYHEANDAAGWEANNGMSGYTCISTTEMTDYSQMATNQPLRKDKEKYADLNNLLWVMSVLPAHYNSQSRQKIQATMKTIRTRWENRGYILPKMSLENWNPDPPKKATTNKKSPSKSKKK